MDFVNDVHLVPSERWWVLGILPQAANVLDAVIRCTVNFDDIDRTAADDVAARVALVARFDSIARRCAIDRTCDDAGSRRLSHAAGSAEEIRMVNPPACECVAKCCRDVVLTDNFSESLRAPLPCGDNVF